MFCDTFTAFAAAAVFAQHHGMTMFVQSRNFFPILFVSPRDQQLAVFPLGTSTVPSDPPPATVCGGTQSAAAKNHRSRSCHQEAAQMGTSSSEPPGTSSGCLHSSLSLPLSLTATRAEESNPLGWRPKVGEEENGGGGKLCGEQRRRRGETNDGGGSGRDEERDGEHGEQRQPGANSRGGEAGVRADTRTLQSFHSSGGALIV